MKSQTSLSYLGLQDSILSSSETEDLLSWLCSLKDIETPDDVSFYNALNFESDAACELLAQLVDKAHQLE